MKKCIEKIWYLMEELLPEKIIWAYLKIYDDNSEEVITYTGKVYLFPQKYTINNHDYEDNARNWLNQEEYSPYEYLLEDGEIDSSICPPVGETDDELISKMCIEITNSKETK